MDLDFSGVILMEMGCLRVLAITFDVEIHLMCSVREWSLRVCDITIIPLV